MYKAKIFITGKAGKYAPGDIVPDEQAKIWESEYGTSPVEFIPDAKPIEPKKGGKK